MSVTVFVADEQVFDAELLADLVSAATIGDILIRVEEGIGSQDQRLKPYSEGYRRKLEREGRSTNVDLRYTGKMLTQIGEIERRVLLRSDDGIAMSVRITFGVKGGDNRDNIAAYNDAIRPWFRLSPKGETRVADAIRSGTARGQRNTTQRAGGIVRRRR